MPDDRVVAVGQARALGDAALDELEVAVLRHSAVEAADAVEQLAAGEQVRGLGDADAHLVLVVLGAVHVDERPRGARLLDVEADAAGQQVGALEPGEPALEPSGSGRQSASQKARTAAEEISTARLRVAYELVGGPNATFTWPSAVAIPSVQPSVDPSSPMQISKSSRGSVWRARHASSSRMSSEPLRTGVITLTLGICRRR